MTDREYEQYLQSDAWAKQHKFDFSFWLGITGLGFVIPLITFLLHN